MFAAAEAGAPACARAPAAVCEAHGANARYAQKAASAATAGNIRAICIEIEQLKF